MLGTLLGAVLALSPGAQSAETPSCHPPPRETRMEAYQRIRGEFGFRTDAAYIRSLIRRRLFYTDVERIPATRREQRYLRLRDRLDFSRRAERYLLRRPRVYVSSKIEDAWPRGPYLVVLVTRDGRKHLRVLRRLVRYPNHLRVRRVPLSRGVLDRLTDRIDPEAAERDGFTIGDWGPDYERGVVEVTMLTDRTDADAYFRSHYGPHVRVVVTGTELYGPECRALDGYRGGGARLTVAWIGGEGDRFDRVEIVEHDDCVEIGIVVQAYQGPHSLVGHVHEQVVELARPLAGRRVIDASTGQRVRRDR